MHKKAALICDIDGTLADNTSHRSPYDYEKCVFDGLYSHINELLGRYIRDHEIILVSGRPSDYRAQTEEWLTMNMIHYHQLFMRAKDDFRKDDVVKEEIYRNHIEPNFDVKFVLDDRNRVVDMWRRIGLVCLQVAPGDF